MGDREVQGNEANVNRRDFVAAAAVAGGLLALGCARLAKADDASASGDVVDVGPKTDFAQDGANMTWSHSKHLVVMRESGKLYAMSSRCTHRGCVLGDAGDHLHCPCHGSDFGYDGSPTGGPAHDPLTRYGISTNDAGHVLVDPQKKFTQDQWSDPASFVAVG